MSVHCMVARRWLVGCLWSCLCATVASHAGAAQDEGAERARIARERASVEQRFAERELDCRSRFAVTACVDQARRERREALALLRRQQILLDEAQRKLRAAQRMQAIRDKVSGAEAQQKAPLVREPRETVRKPDVPAAAASAAVARDPTRGKPRAAPAPQGQRSASSAADRAVHEARSKERFKASQEAAAAHRQALERRNAQRAGKRKPALPLPTPASALTP